MVVEAALPGRGTFYYAVDLCQLGGSGEACIYSGWIYQESNAMPGLQRGDERRDDTCGGEIEPDAAPLA